MMTMKKYLKQLVTIRRKKQHPLVHKIHKKYSISKKTLFYIKEYGKHANVQRTIIRESIKILLLASIISSLGGLMLEHIKIIFVSILPLVILLPVLNDMIGDYGTIVSSRFSTMLHEGKIKTKWWKTPELRKLFAQISIISLITAGLSFIMALVISAASDYSVAAAVASKIFFITIVDVVILVTILFFVSIIFGTYFYQKKEDPNNLLIPITTSIADFGNMALLSMLVIIFF